jgi:hypothetical protein
MDARSAAHARFGADSEGSPSERGGGVEWDKSASASRPGVPLYAEVTEGLQPRKGPSDERHCGDVVVCEAVTLHRGQVVAFSSPRLPAFDRTTQRTGHAQNA